MDKRSTGNLEACSTEHPREHEGLSHAPTPPFTHTFFKLAGLFLFFSVLLWRWAGNNPQAKCTVTCCAILPFVAGGVCCFVIGHALTALDRHGDRCLPITDHSLRPLTHLAWTSLSWVGWCWERHSLAA